MNPPSESGRSRRDRLTAENRQLCGWLERPFGPWLLAGWCFYWSPVQASAERTEERSMRTWLTGLAFGACTLLSSSVTAQAPADDASIERLLNRVNIEYETFTLDN